MRVLVCGGRNHSGRLLLRLTLDGIHSESGISLLINGGASGADRLSQEWAQSRFIATAQFMAEWDKHGRAAGPIRNQKMIDEGKPDLVVAFAGGKGTADMVRRARNAGIAVKEVLE
jgi:hypothetical protein